MTKEMSDAQIDQYIAEVRKWPRKPSDYGPETESVIRRILRGDIQPPYGQVDYGPGSDGTGEGTEPPGIRPADDGPELTAEEKRADSIANYDLALETIHHKDDQ